MDEMVSKKSDFLGDLEFSKVPLLIDKRMYLIRVFEIDSKKNKKYLRNSGIMIYDVIIVSNFSDTTHFMEELNLFDVGNEQNKYFEISKQKNIKSLKVKNIGKKNIYISRSEARAIYKIYNLSFFGYSMSRVLEFEFKFTPQNLTMLLSQNGLLRE